MQPTSIRSATWVLAACMAAGAAFAQSRPAGDPATLSSDDVSFLKQAAQNGHAEVESGKLALRKAAADAEEAAREVDSAEVKAFAAKALPTLQKHMSMAQELHTSRQGTADNGGERQGSATGARQ